MTRENILRKSVRNKSAKMASDSVWRVLANVTFKYYQNPQDEILEQNISAEYECKILAQNISAKYWCKLLAQTIIANESRKM